MIKYLFIIILAFAPIQNAQAQYDGPILKAAALLIDRIVSFVKVNGERVLAQLSKRAATALIRAKKEEAIEISSALRDEEIYKQKQEQFRNIGPGKKIYYKPPGSYRPQAFNVSGIAPSACLDQYKSKLYRGLTITYIDAIYDTYGIVDGDFSSRTLTNSTSADSDIMRDINNITIDDNNKGVGLYPSKTTLIEPNSKNFKSMAAKGLKFTYKKPPIDMNKLDEDELSKAVRSDKGQNWLAYYYSAAAVFDVVYTSMAEHLAIDSGNGQKTTIAIEREKVALYASSFKRTLANQVKYKAGSIMELNHLSTGLLNAKLDEHEMLLKERNMLLIMGIKRLRDLRADM
jgi:hypothetical protein